MGFAAEEPRTRQKALKSGRRSAQASISYMRRLGGARGLPGKLPAAISVAGEFISSSTGLILVC